MPFVIGGAMLASSLIGGYGASQAADAQEAAARESAQVQREGLALQREMWEAAQAQQQPWLQTGEQALSRLSALINEGDLSGFKSSPGYQWRLNQGIQAIDRSAAARGGVGGGGHLAALQEYGQGMASAEYTDYINRLAGLAGTGQTAAQSLGGLGASYAGMGQQSLANIGQSIMQGGQAQAAGYLGTTGAIQQGINQGLWAYGSGMFNPGMTQTPYGPQVQGDAYLPGAMVR